MGKPPAAQGIRYGAKPRFSFWERCNFQEKIAMHASADLHTIEATVTSIT
jgi:hypothetical protein